MNNDDVVNVLRNQAIDAMDTYAQALAAPSPQPVAESQKPYAFEFRKSNGDGTYSVMIDRTLPANATNIKPLFDTPAAALQPVAGLTDAREFTEGVVYACARIIECFDLPTVAVDILQQSGVDLKLGCPEDLAFIERHLTGQTGATGESE